MILFGGFFTLGLWLVSLFLPMFADNPEAVHHFHGIDKFGNISGSYVLLNGWFGPMLQPNYWGWYANIPFLASVVRCLKDKPPSFVMAAAGWALASTFFIPLDHVVEQLFVPATGFWFWYAGFAILLIVAFCEKYGRDEIYGDGDETAPSNPADTDINPLQNPSNPTENTTNSI